MPDIYKKGYFLDEDDSVMIPGFQKNVNDFQEIFPSNFGMGDSAEGGETGESSGSTELEQFFTGREVEELLIKERERVRAELRQEVTASLSRELEQPIRLSLQRVDALLEQIEGEHASFLEEYRDRLAGMAVDIAEKVTLHKIAEEDQFLSSLVLSAVHSVQNADWITVQVSEELSDLVSALSKRLKGPEYKDATLLSMDCPPGTCILETPEGSINASVEEQMQNLRDEFGKL